MTLEAYINVRAMPGYVQQIVFRGDDQGNYPYFLGIEGGNLEFRIVNANGNIFYVYAPFTPYVGQWVHVAGTFANATGTLSLYINGNQVATNTTTIRPFAILTGPMQVWVSATLNRLTAIRNILMV